MASPDPRVRRAVIKYANAHQQKPKSASAIAEAKRDLTAAQVEFFIESALAEAPPLTAEQTQRIARLLVGGEGK